MSDSKQISGVYVGGPTTLASGRPIQIGDEITIDAAGEDKHLEPLISGRADSEGEDATAASPRARRGRTTSQETDS